MDPDATYAEALDAAWEIVLGTVVPGTVAAGTAERCAEALLALDAWLRGGGFLPESWITGRERVTELLDPDAVLAEALAAAHAVLDENDEGAALLLARRTRTLSAWLSSSGALPAAWTP